MYLPEFQTTGRALADSGLISGASGNLSIRLKDVEVNAPVSRDKFQLILPPGTEIQPLS